MLNFNEFMSTINITQGYNTYPNGTHNIAIDLAGKDGGIEFAYVPKGQKIKCIDYRYEPSANVYYSFYEFVYPVILSNGKKETVQFMCLHGAGSDKKGNIYSEGQAFYDEGTMGKAYGNHIHIEFGKGYNGSNYFLKQASNGVWTANFTTFFKAEEIFYITKTAKDSGKVKSTAGIKFRETDYGTPVKSTIKTNCRCNPYGTQLAITGLIGLDNAKNTWIPWIDFYDIKTNIKYTPKAYLKKVYKDQKVDFNLDLSNLPKGTYKVYGGFSYNNKSYNEHLWTDVNISNDLTEATKEAQVLKIDYENNRIYVTIK